MGVISVETAAGYERSNHERYSRPRMTSLQIRLDWSTRSTGLLSESRHLISPPPRNSITAIESATRRGEREWGKKGDGGLESRSGAKLTHVDLLVQLVVYNFKQAHNVRMATELHDRDLFFDFVFLAAEVVGDGEMGPRARDPPPLELVEAVCAGVMARHDFDGLGERGAYRSGREGVIRDTHDSNAVLSEIPTFVDGAMLALTDRGTAEVMVQYDTSGGSTGPALAYSVCDADVCGGVKGRAAHDLKIGRVHRVGSIKGGGRVYMRGAR